ncbi:MAG: phosphate acetyltransferase [Candidatus Omnitrophota bacterium]|nr:MAG: phosphate acetyltransferase [Candidatus Omnitrophota bacterium]
MEILDKIEARAAQVQKTIVLPETDDLRILKAAKIVTAKKLANIILLGDITKVKDKAESIGFDLSVEQVINPLESEYLPDFVNEFYALRKHKGISLEQAKEQMQNYVYFSAMMVRKGLAHGFVAGSITTTADVVKAAIYCIGFGEKIRTVSSCFLVCVPNCIYGEQGMFVFADCAIIPDPSPMQLANIAYSAADFYEMVVESEPKVALLSFSTKGSAEHPLVEKVIRAKQLITQKYPNLVVDGELQLDAAIVPDVAEKKAPQSPVAGSANVLVFPDLNAGNIGYKLVQRLAKAEVVGPILLGFKNPCSDLSRGCSVDEIVNAVCMTAVRGNC